MTLLADPTQLPAAARTWRVVPDLRAIALRLLRRMYHDDLHLFCYRLASREGEIKVEGVSHRYTAIALIGLATQNKDVSDHVLGEGGLDAVNEQLLHDLPRLWNLGDAALILWAMIAQRNERAKRALERVKEFEPADRPHPTVEVAWALAALSVDPDFLTDRRLADRLARRLLDSFHPDSALFPHGQGLPRDSAWRGHIACFADWVYPVHALAHHYLAAGGDEVADVVKPSTIAMIRRQGPAGQWWWHHDVRTGRVIEPYPVYSVHQDAMAPMALFAAERACGINVSEPVQQGLDWLLSPPECRESLVDHQADVIWRKVGRRESRKWARGMQAFASRLHPSWRIPGVDFFWPANAIDRECRPYHLGWFLYAFPGDPL
jgi:hypothetical protein